MESSNRFAWNNWKAAQGHWTVPFIIEGLGATSVSTIAVIQVNEWGWSFAGQAWTGVLAFFISLVLWGALTYVWYWEQAPRKQLSELSYRQSSPDRKDIRLWLSEFAKQGSDLSEELLTSGEDLNSEEYYEKADLWSSSVSGYIEVNAPDLVAIYLAEELHYAMTGGWRAKLSRRIDMKVRNITEVIKQLHD